MNLVLGQYLHYKGTIYEVIALGKIEATLEDVVIYKGPDGVVWVRSYDDFTAKVISSQGEVPRFTYLPR